MAARQDTTEQLLSDVARIERMTSAPQMLQLITAITGLRLSLIARVTEDRWMCAAAHDAMNFGLKPKQELELATTLCREVRDRNEPIVIEDVPNDETYRDHHTPKIYGLKSYVAVPIFKLDGSYFGNVCALDSEPRPLKSVRTAELLTLFAQLVSFHLEQDERQQQAVKDLSNERATGGLRDQFIAILGHDLRTPLSSIVTYAEVLAQKSDPEVAKLGGRIRESGLRVGRMTSDVLDFARGRIAGGIPVIRRPIDFAPVLDAIVHEVSSTSGDRKILVDTHASRLINVDADRLQQVATNLLANAIAHGKPGTVIILDARMDGEDFLLTVSNEGEPVPEEKRQRIFEPYVRSEGTGLGLGLYIVSEIMKSHGGTVEMRHSTPKRTSFVCRFPAVI